MSPIPQKVVHLLSGGIDSTVLLHDLRISCAVYPVIFDYGQSHDIEVEHARRICHKLGVNYQVIQLPRIFRGSALTSGGKSNVVPNRNAVMLSIAASLAVQMMADSVTIACNMDDQAQFPDCRPQFIAAMNAAAYAATDGRVEICAPYINLTKRQIVEKGRKLCVAFDETWSCYSPVKHEPCGGCDACRLRLLALE